MEITEKLEQKIAKLDQSANNDNLTQICWFFFQE